MPAGVDMPRLCAPLRLPVSGRTVHHLLPPEETALRRGVASRLPHADLVPLLVAAREARERYDDWSRAWDDPVV